MLIQIQYSRDGKRTKDFHNSLLIIGDNGDALATDNAVSNDIIISSQESHVFCQNP